MRLAALAAALAAGALAAVARVPAASVRATASAEPDSPAVSPRPTPPVFAADVDLVSLSVVVYDKAGRFVPGLRPADVQVLEDGVPQKIAYFRAASGGDERIPLSVVLVLDASGSMRENLGFLQQAAAGFLQRLENDDQAMVVSFNNSVKGSAEFSADRGRLEEFVDALQAWGGTSLYDAIHYALGRVKDQAGRKALVVFSDGADTTSTLRDQDVLDYARAVEATIYCVGIEGGGPGGGSPRGFLRRVAQESGGEYFFPDRVADLTKVFARIAEELRQHYALAYSPARPADGSFRQIQVRVARPDVSVRARKGYFAVKRRRGAR